MEKEDRVPFAAPNLVNLCIQEIREGDWSGCWFHLYDRQPIRFQGTAELLQQLEKFFDALQYPQASTRYRSFREEETAGQKRGGGEKEIPCVSRTELQEHTGNCGAVILAVQYRQNTTWQGKAFVLKTGETFLFSSELDLLKKIENTLEEAAKGNIS